MTSCTIASARKVAKNTLQNFRGIMDITAINEILLPPVLLLIVFCFACCQIPRHSHSATVYTELINAVDLWSPVVENDGANLEDSVEDLTPANSMEDVPMVLEPVDLEPVVLEPVVLEPVQAQQQTVTPELYDQAVTVINGLNKVQLRKLCKPLGVQQKRNGVELSKQLMAGNIKKVFKTNPELVISTISERLDIEIVLQKEDSIDSIDSLQTA